MDYNEMLAKANNRPRKKTKAEMKHEEKMEKLKAETMLAAQGKEKSTVVSTIGEMAKGHAKLMTGFGSGIEKLLDKTGDAVSSIGKGVGENADVVAGVAGAALAPQSAGAMGRVITAGKNKQLADADDVTTKQSSASAVNKGKQLPAAVEDKAAKVMEFF